MNTYTTIPLVFAFDIITYYVQRKSTADKQAPSKSRPQKVPKNVEYSSPNSMAMDDEMDDIPNNTETRPQRPKRLKRPTKSVNENLEPAFTATQITGQDGNQKLPLPDPSPGGWRTGVEEDSPRQVN